MEKGINKRALALGGAKHRTIEWKTEEVIATKADEALGYTAGLVYTLFVCLADTESKSGRKYKKGDYFAIAKEDAAEEE
mgnify:CR=1 FL=1